MSGIMKKKYRIRKNVLKKHIELERELNENGKIVEMIDDSEV